MFYFSFLFFFFVCMKYYYLNCLWIVTSPKIDHRTINQTSNNLRFSLWIWMERKMSCHIWILVIYLQHVLCGNAEIMKMIELSKNTRFFFSLRTLNTLTLHIYRHLRILNWQQCFKIFNNFFPFASFKSSEKISKHRVLLLGVDRAMCVN